MRTCSRLTFVALAAAFIMNLAVSSATAGRLSTSNTGFRLTWATLNFSAGAEFVVSCPITLEGSFHSATIRKVAGALIGSITRGIVHSLACRGSVQSRATILQESLPWHLTYESFAGTLPNITSIAVLLARYAVQASATILGITVTCLYADQGAPEENLGFAIARNSETGALSTTTAVSGRRARFVRGSSGACPQFLSATGTGQVFLLGNTTRISVTLI
jgi:hypothetical protein